MLLLHKYVRFDHLYIGAAACAHVHSTHLIHILYFVIVVLFNSVYIQWSPKGSYFATLVPNKGVILWGGKNFEKLGRFPAPGVDFVTFSPQENYLLTNNNNRNDPQAIKVFSIRTGKLLRAFSLFPKDYLEGRTPEVEGQPIPPPPFQWSHDDKYLARMGKDLISIFETPTMTLLDKRSLGCDGIHEFQFSPKANIIAYWAPEHKNQPAHVDLVELPSRKSLRQKSKSMNFALTVESKFPPINVNILQYYLS